jgi:hypothetical protein
VTYREAPIREPIEPPWADRRISRPLAIGLGVAGAASSALVGVLASPIAGLAALLLMSGSGLTLLWGGGGEGREITRDPQSPEDPLRRAGLHPVGWTEWRAQREGFPVRIVYAVLSLRTRIELALGSVPGLTLEVEPQSDGLDVHSDKMAIAGPVVAMARRRCAEMPPSFALAIEGRVLQTRLSRVAHFEGYRVVLSALDFTVAVAQALLEHGEGLPPFRRGRGSSP